MSRPPAHRLIVFSAFAALAAGDWGSLVADPPIVRLVIVAAAAIATAAALAALPLDRLSRARRSAYVTLIALVGLATSLIALGVPAHELVPWGWGKLADDLDRGFRGLSGSFDYPYAGDNGTSRWLLTAAMPVLLIAAAVLAFGRRGRSGADALALVLLVAAFAVPATIRPAAAPFLWGAVLLILISLWLWQRPRRGIAAAVTIACFGAIAVPIASGLDGKDPVLDYRDWTLPADNLGTGFDWDQSFGPIDWERSHDTLFEVHTDQPRYLRAEVLDEFYGYGWRRSETGGAPVPEDTDPTDGTLSVTRGKVSKWVDTTRISVSKLDSPLVISPGTEYDLSGVDGSQRDPDGTVHAADDPLVDGKNYSVTAYSPDPGPALMRARSRTYPVRMSPYTALAFPYSQPDPETGQVTVHRADVPLWGSGYAPDEVLVKEIANSPYKRIAALSARLTAGAPSAYDAARTVENYVRNRGTYTEDAPDHAVPLDAFLFGDRLGYCQHFSGAMALMLRFAGIPARVAAGFTPGERQGAPGPEESTYAVTSFDAHSWVEVYFNGIGWVPFDPTPGNAPARQQNGAQEAVPSGRADASARGNPDDDRSNSRNREPGFSGGQGLTQDFSSTGEEGGGPGLALLLLLLIPAAALAAFTFVRSLRHRRLSPEDAAELELREIAAALGPAGFEGAGLTTLKRLEDHLRRLNLLRAAAYVDRLGALRFARTPGDPPTLAERRAARRDLSTGGGPTRFLRMLVAMPPGGPRR